MRTSSYASMVAVGLLFTFKPQFSKGVELTSEWGFSDFTNDLQDFLGKAGDIVDEIASDLEDVLDVADSLGLGDELDSILPVYQIKDTLDKDHNH